MRKLRVTKFPVTVAFYLHILNKYLFKNDLKIHLFMHENLQKNINSSSKSNLFFHL